MLVLINFLSKISYALLYNKSSNLYKKILLEILFHSEIKKYIETNQEIIVTDKDIEGLLLKTQNKNNTELITNIIYEQISRLSCLNYNNLLKKKINWNAFIKYENEIIKITSND